MENYIGVKEIKATPMSKELAIISGYKTGDSNEKEGYEVEYEGGYKSWSPKDVFEASYRKTSGLTFGLAIEALKKGKKVARIGWNGKGMWIAVGGQPVELAAEGFWNPHARKHAEDNGGKATVLPYIIFKTATDEILMGWLASQTDILAEDWMIIE